MAQKTPISLMNELAKANQLTAEYRTVEQSGPAHKRTFRVHLVLGEIGVFEGTASSIKAAKHVAASAALEKCGLSLPEKKPKGLPLNITPTVELNGLAMKLGKHTAYRDLPTKTPPFQPQGAPGYQGVPGINPPTYQRIPGQYRNYQSNPYHRPSVPRIFCVSLTVGNTTYIGEGCDKQKARHAAATKAIEVLRKEFAAAEMAKVEKNGVESTVETNTVDNGELTVGNGEKTTAIPSVEADAMEERETDEKSEISMVYEIATKRKLPVSFEEITNSGPAHMKKFTIRCLVGEIVAEGEGPKKKLAKQNAAQKILDELNKLPPLPESVAQKGNRRFVRRPGRSQFRPKPKSDIDPTLNPISILGQMMQQHHEQPPEYKCLQEKDCSSDKPFIMQVQVSSHSQVYTCTGRGSNKKTAKKDSAEAMLKLLGFREQPNEGEVTATAPATQGGTDGRLERSSDGNPSLFSEQSGSIQPTILGRQLKPGLLPMVPEVAKQMGSDMMNSVVAPIAQVKLEKQDVQDSRHQGGLNRAPGAPVAKNHTVSDILGATKVSSKPLTQVQKLLHLAEVEGFRVQFTDYPKDNKGVQEFLTVVTISSVPPLTCYGSGATTDISREEAASNALGPLLQLGMDRSKTSKDGAEKAIKEELKDVTIDTKSA